MARTRIKVQRVQEAHVFGDYDEAGYRKWLGDYADSLYMRQEFIRSGRDWGDALDDLLSSIPEADWKTVDTSDNEDF